MDWFISNPCIWIGLYPCHTYGLFYIRSIHMDWLISVPYQWIGWYPFHMYGLVYIHSIGLDWFISIPYVWIGLYPLNRRKLYEWTGQPLPSPKRRVEGRERCPAQSHDSRIAKAPLTLPNSDPSVLSTPTVVVASSGVPEFIWIPVFWLLLDGGQSKGKRLVMVRWRPSLCPKPQWGKWDPPSSTTKIKRAEYGNPA